MFKLGILSDTHLDKITDHFKSVIRETFADVDMIVHAGDMTCLEVYDYLSNWELKAVRGNMDNYGLSSVLPDKRVEEIQGKRIGIMHGRGAPDMIEDVVFKEFDDIDVIIFGHSHTPKYIKKEGVILFNPGAYKSAPNQPGTAGIMEIGKELNFRHIKIRS
jgi:uncharacterized protein